MYERDSLSQRSPQPATLVDDNYAEVYCNRALNRKLDNMKCFVGTAERLSRQVWTCSYLLEVGLRGASLPTDNERFCLQRAGAHS